MEKKKCPKCDKLIDRLERFCKHCGHNLKKDAVKVEKVIKKEVSYLPHLLFSNILLVLIVLVVVIFLIFGFTYKVPVEVQVPYEAKEVYTEDQIQEGQKCSYAEFAYSLENIKKYDRVGHYYIQFDLLNLEEVPGEFTYTLTFKSKGFEPDTRTRTVELLPKSKPTSLTFKKTFIEVYRQVYKGQPVEVEGPVIKAPSIQKCKPTSKKIVVEKERPVIKYRTEVRYVSWLNNFLKETTG